MAHFVRIVLTIVAAITGYALASIALLVALPQETPTPIRVALFLLQIGAGYGAGRLVWKRPVSSTDSPGLARAIAIGALIVGGIGFIGGFIGPMIFSPRSNQGPLLGILITGPIGVIMGAIGGGLNWVVRRKRAL